MQTSLKYANIPLSKRPLANVRFLLPAPDLTADRFCSCSLSLMHETSKELERYSTVFALQPHHTPSAPAARL